MTRVVLVPGVLALLPEYAGLEDPVAELRAACLSAVAWLGPDGRRCSPTRRATRVADALLDGMRGFRRPPTGASYLVVGNGSACRSEKAPGHLDERAAAYDDALRAALTSSRHANWPDIELGKGLLASLDGISRLREVAAGGHAGAGRLRRRPVRRAVLGDEVAVREGAGRAGHRRPRRAVRRARRVRPWLRVNMVSSVDGAATGESGQERLAQQRRRQAGLRPPPLDRRRDRGRCRHGACGGLPAGRPPDRRGQPARRAAGDGCGARPGLGAS